MVITAERVSSPPLKVEQAYQELKQRIVTLEMPPGSTIDERELMWQLDFGRTPIREALLRLTHERLIVHSPRRGAWVSELSIIDLHQMLAARDGIEPLVAADAAMRVTPENVCRLGAIVSSGGAAAERDDHEEIVRHELAFHSELACLSGNTYYASFTEQLLTALMRYWHVALRRGDRQTHWQRKHQMLLDAVASGDPACAAGRAREHIANFKSSIQRLVI